MPNTDYKFNGMHALASELSIDGLTSCIKFKFSVKGPIKGQDS